jgi:hypothetical protein
LPSIDAERYRRWIELMVAGGQAMIRYYSSNLSLKKAANRFVFGTESGEAEFTKTIVSTKPVTSSAC